MTYELFTQILTIIGEYERAIHDARDKLDVLFYHETGVKGVGYTNTILSHNPSLSALKRLDSIEEIDELEREINEMEQQLENQRSKVDAVMKKMPKSLQDMLLDKYINRMTYIEIGEKYGYSNAGIWHAIRRETEKYL